MTTGRESRSRSLLIPTLKGGDIAKCYHCGKVLADTWIITQGASIMGRTGGKTKQRKNARQAALARWQKQRKKKEE
jgi:hypothetical protein